MVHVVNRMQEEGVCHAGVCCLLYFGREDKEAEYPMLSFSIGFLEAPFDVFIRNS